MLEGLGVKQALVTGFAARAQRFRTESSPAARPAAIRVPGTL